MRNRKPWNAAAAAIVLLVLPVLAIADQPAASPSTDTPRQATQELVVPLESNVAPDTISAAKSAQPSDTGFVGSLCNLATGYLGTPYRWGGTTPKAFDCSGFTRFVYSKLGVKLPRTAKEQFLAGARVSGAALKAGDLVFFDMMKGYVSHVGMYLGNGMFIHASTPRTGVRIDKIQKYARHIVGARRYMS